MPAVATREKLYVDTPFTKAAEDASTGDLTLLGYGSTYSKDRDGESVATTAFDKSLPDYLNRNPIILWQHDPHQPIGQAKSGKTDATGLYLKASVPNPGPDAADWQRGAYTAIRLGIVKTFSIGGYFERSVEQGKSGPVFTIDEVELFEISVVSIPANPDSLFEAVMKSWTGGPQRMSDKASSQLEQLLGVVDLSDPELFLMDEPARAKRYDLLRGMFAKAHAGALPPTMDAWPRIRAAQKAGADSTAVVQAKLRFLSALTRPEVAEKAGRMISAANRTKLQGAMDAHQMMEDGLIDAAESMKAVAQAHADSKTAIQDVIGVPDDEASEDPGVADENESADQEPTVPPKKPKAAAAATKDCPTCDGTGKVKGNTTKCPTCQGSGTVAADYEPPAKAAAAGMMTCPTCKGSGEIMAPAKAMDVPMMECPTCMGKGEVPQGPTPPKAAADEPPHDMTGKTHVTVDGEVVGHTEKLDGQYHGFLHPEDGAEAGEKDLGAFASEAEAAAAVVKAYEAAKS